MLRNRGVRTAERITRQIFPIVDTHQHLWYKDQWESSFFNELCKGKSQTTSVYEEETKYLDIIASVFVETNPSPADRVKEATFISSVCAAPDNNTFGLIGSVDYNSRLMPNQVNKHINRAEERPYYKGVRDIAHTRPPNYLVTNTAIENYQYLGNEGLLTEIIMRPEDLSKILPVVKLCTGTTFILNHCGGIQGLKGDAEKENLWAHAMEKLGREHNVICKVSGLAGGWGADPRVEENGWSFDLQAKYVKHALQCFGDLRLIFGLDWPVSSSVKGANLQHYIDGVHEIAKDVGGSKLVDRLFYDNALKLYDITLKGENEKYTPKKNVQKRYVSQNYISETWPEKKGYMNTDESMLDMFYGARQNVNRAVHK